MSDDLHFHCWHIEATVHTGGTTHMVRCCGCQDTNMVHADSPYAVHGHSSVVLEDGFDKEVEADAKRIRTEARERRQRFRDALRGPLARFHL